MAVCVADVDVRRDGKERNGIVQGNRRLYMVVSAAEAVQGQIFTRVQWMLPSGKRRCRVADNCG